MKTNRILIIANERNGDSAGLARAIRFAAKRNAQLTLLRRRGCCDDVLEDPEIRGMLSGAKLMEFETSTDEALASVSNQRHDLIIRTACPQTGKLTRMFRHPDAQFARECPCPIWMIKSARRPDGPNRILAVIDPIASNPECQGLAAEILDTAASLAKNDRAELHVLSAWDVPTEPMLRGRTIHVSEVMRLVQQIGEAHEKLVRELVSKVDYPDIAVHVRRGRPDKLIREVVASHGIDDVVVGIDGSRPGVRQHTPQSGVQRYFDAARCSVLAVKPADGIAAGASA